MRKSKSELKTELKIQLENLSYLIDDIVLLNKKEVKRQFEGANKFLLLSDLLNEYDLVNEEYEILKDEILKDEIESESKIESLTKNKTKEDEEKEDEEKEEN